MQVRCKLLVAAVLAAVPCLAGAAETYRNPVIDDNLADPVVIRHDGTFYLYATGEVQGDNGYRVYTSEDLVNWQRGPVVFQPGQRHIWAPDVWRDPDSGRFYLYYTANQTVGVAAAEGPLGPFSVRRKLFDIHRRVGLGRACVALGYSTKPRLRGAHRNRNSPALLGRDLTRRPTGQMHDDGLAVA